MPFASATGGRELPLIAHVVYRFATGGLENGVVNLVNRLPRDRFRHVIVSLTDADPEFASRITDPAVPIVALDKPPGHAIRLYPTLYRLFRQWRPTVVHTRNLAALEAQAPAWLARVPLRLHGEHGRDLEDLDGTSRRMRLLRRAYQPFVHRYVALSRDLATYLTRDIGVDGARVEQIYNGVDTERFAPRTAGMVSCPGPMGEVPGLFWVGTVGRMQGVKNQLLLAHAFVAARRARADLRSRLRLAMIGDGPSMAMVRQALQDGGALESSWLPGGRDDVAEVMRGLSLFVLPSLAEGVSNTLLEAMASGVPVVATAVGGNPELVTAGEVGWLVPPGDVAAMAARIIEMADDASAAARMGAAGRQRVLRHFGIDEMVDRYAKLYGRGVGHEVAQAGER
jgi:sugar transferase (PEP-CTERM/EpsH1 system associated)